MATDLREATDTLLHALAPLRFEAPVTFVYNPLKYARPMWDAYLERFGSSPKEVVLFGMNPGPWGMVQTGIPFGEVAAVRDWMKLDEPISRPANEHPKRPVEGLSCRRSEVSGRRVWEWAQSRFGTADAFFQRFFVANYCPLAFLEESGRNFTPDKLPMATRQPLLEACDRALLSTMSCLRPRVVVGIGRFAYDRARRLLHDHDVRIGTIPHPSPASPIANRGWAALADQGLAQLGIRVP
jgi:single-strand selective monofunctional uracil DNA glycosylase